jgi:hypothetical protein
MPATDPSPHAQRRAAGRPRGDRDVAGPYRVPPQRPRRVNRSGPRLRHALATAFAGVDYEGNTRKDLYVRASLLGVRGRSRMSKAELARAIADTEAAFLRPRGGGAGTLPRAA